MSIDCRSSQFRVREMQNSLAVWIAQKRVFIAKSWSHQLKLAFGFDVLVFRNSVVSITLIHSLRCLSMSSLMTCHAFDSI